MQIFYTNSLERDQGDRDPVSGIHYFFFFLLIVKISLATVDPLRISFIFIVVVHDHARFVVFRQLK